MVDGKESSRYWCSIQVSLRLSSTLFRITEILANAESACGHDPFLALFTLDGCKLAFAVRCSRLLEEQDRRQSLTEEENLQIHRLRWMRGLDGNLFETDQPNP